MVYFYKGDILTFDYVNYKGKKATRVVEFDEILFGANHFHPKPQFLLFGRDLETDEIRGFAMKDITNFGIALRDEEHNG